MAKKEHRYEGESIVVTYDAGRCIHAAECVHGLPAVFDPKARPWVDPDAGSAEEVREVVRRCPTGALRFHSKADPSPEPPPAENKVTIDADGPLFASGDLKVVTPDGDTIVEDVRIALCRCGASQNKPFCDGAHSKAEFRAEGTIPDPQIRQLDTESRELTIVVAANGPLILDGPVTLEGGDGDDRCAGTKTALCRCGASENKPFCDGAHARVGFEG